MSDKPAIYGGKPVCEHLLPLAGAAVDDNDIQAVTEVLRGGRLGCGETVQRFERAVAEYVGARYAVALSSGAAGLHVALMSAAVGHEEEVITSPLTHPATANCILYQGGIHTFADINSATFNINPGAVASKISSRTEALIPVHFAGNPCDLDALHKLARDNNLIVIEDAAHALGGEYDGKKIGALSDLTVFSFSDPQHCYTGEGGVVTTNSEELYEWMMIFRENGLVSNPRKLTRNEGPWRVEMQDRGYNYRMTEMQAALGIAQLARAEEFIERRTAIAEMYNQVLAGHPAVLLPEQNPRGRSTWHYFLLALRLEHIKASRSDIFHALRAENVEVGVHYLPVFLHPYYLWIGHPDVCTLEGSLCPRAEELYQCLLTLPLYPAMTDRDVQDVITAVIRVLNYYML
ncbi:DegT/DnrJ/EryC1/StrS family aminotransferase [Desulfoscipio gibsoniae]|uniref:Putative PLP-dependent enzyme possibly involved in cell wall biogenesis n=1 Tax=Desulfoscipio gibsoniae DSM 7213 TaxID=767817 RepID=R4KJ24_9FIRM|nr:aminotransferase class I/II-fold pyridoxal phosphate-dependent enzyme [Desulfoscipio gibsoniae]AGL02614.1 putative PLP-dependent enzyme possibly involved in cell wall biogenesis [Desulfoscipio gibsoniae DSM 7213]